MTHDPNLVEVVALALAASEGYDWDSLPDDWSFKGGDEALVGRNDLRKNARDALTAIDASGTHWVAPTKITLDGFSQSDLDAMCTAHLAEQPDKDTGTGE